MMFEIIVKNGQLQIKPIEDHSLLLRNIAGPFVPINVVELGEATYMLNNLIIEQMKVVRQLETDVDLLDLTKVPMFDIEKRPFVMFRDYNGF